jgi:hypothetical protein
VVEVYIPEPRDSLDFGVDELSGKTGSHIHFVDIRNGNQVIGSVDTSAEQDVG